MINECIIVSKEVGDKFILAKNRDRMYNPELEIVHTIIDGVEVAYLHDLITDWSEGLNEHGIGVVNSALLVGHDEAEAKIVKKGGKPGPDGDKMRNIIKQPTLIKAVRAAISYKGSSGLSLKGHTFVSSPKAAMRKEFFPKRPQLNMKRDTNEMSTSSQTVMNLTDKILQITYFKNKVKEFKGITNKLPKDYQPKIKIEVIAE